MRISVSTTLLLTAAAALLAAGAVTHTARAATPLAGGASDLCLAIDDSGSMWTATDQGPASDPGPNPLRAQAARVAVSLLGADVNNARDGVGAVLFGSAQQPGDDIVVLPVTELSSNAARDALYARIEGSLWSKGFTRIDGALQSCLVVLSAAQPQPAQGRIVLVTDGVPVGADPRFDANGQLAALSWTLGELARRHWSVDVILLGATAQRIADDRQSFAHRIAGATSGNVFVATQRTDLLRIYTGIVASMTGRTLVSGDPVDLASVSRVPIRVEDRTAMMTVTVVKSDIGTTVQLLTPDGRDASGQIKRTSTGLVETLTVQEPAPGSWSLRLRGHGQAYVSLVLKAASVPPPPTIAPPAPQPVTPAAGPGGGIAFPWRALGLALAAVLALTAGGFAWRSARADRFAGIVTVADAPAKVVRLADLERAHRILGMVQRPIPAGSLVDALGLRLVRGGDLRAGRGGLVYTSPEGIPTPIAEGGELPVEVEPPTILVYARALETVPQPTVVHTAVRRDAETTAALEVADVLGPPPPAAPGAGADAPTGGAPRADDPIAPAPVLAKSGDVW